jgi:hypothetical protein
MTDHPEPQHIRHDENGTRPAPTKARDIDGARQRITEVLRDPFGFAVALLAEGVVQMPVKPVEPAPRPRATSSLAAPRHKTADEILAGRKMRDIGPLSGKKG